MFKEPIFQCKYCVSHIIQNQCVKLIFFYEQSKLILKNFEIFLLADINADISANKYQWQISIQCVESVA